MTVVWQMACGAFHFIMIHFPIYTCKIKHKHCCNISCDATVRTLWPTHNVCRFVLMCCIVVNTLRPRQMDAISQTTFSNAFSLMKMFELRLKFHWSFVPKGQSSILVRRHLYIGTVPPSFRLSVVYWLIYRKLCANISSTFINWRSLRFMRSL